MRGIVLAGGTGSRLGNLTRVINKHLLPVHDQPMIYWPLKVLRDNGIGDITIVTSPEGIGPLAMLLGSDYTYRVQDRPGGVAQALKCAGRSDGEVAVILGDNVFARLPSLQEGAYIGTARCYLKNLPQGENKSFGVPVVSGTGYITHVIEKPENPTNNFAVTGLYIFNSDLWNKLDVVRSSARGELEIADLLDLYAANTLLSYNIVEGFWGDAGTVDGMAECAAAVRGVK